jgi:hypothetical protein
MGDLYSALGQGEQARQAFSASLAIRQRLAEAEPDRADYQRDLSVSYSRMAAMLIEANDVPSALRMFASDLEIAERLALSEPSRADLQRDLIISLLQLGNYSETDAAQYLSRAWDLGQQLSSSGRATAEDEALLDNVRKLMEQRGVRVD